jgi:hypothetical protein
MTTLDHAVQEECRRILLEEDEEEKECRRILLEEDEEEEGRRILIEEDEEEDCSWFPSVTRRAIHSCLQYPAEDFRITSCRGPTLLPA